MTTNTILTTEELEKVLRGILQKHTNLKEMNGIFVGEIYTDYDDRLSEDQLKKISQSEHIMESYYDTVWEWELSASDFEFNYLLETIGDNWNETVHGEYDLQHDLIIDVISELVEFHLPHDEILNVDVQVNFMIDAGDGNYDYTLNNFLSYNSNYDEYGIDSIEDESAILWLVKQQGYTKEDLDKAITKGTDNKFLRSVIQECFNVTTHMNALSFFVSMTFKDFITLKENKRSVKLDKGSACGLFDCWQGAGSLLEIELEKDVEIPYEFMNIQLDGVHGYGVNSVYGMSESFWTETVIK